jgi:ubiquinone/menaquinone biosynthesis C-methylase UbiE
MNENHDACNGPEWRAIVRDTIIPWALGDGELGDDVLEVGPGFGATTDVFRELVPKLTSVEVDPELAGRLAERLAGTNVTVIEGDATALTFGDDRFSGATSFSMLHHVPSAHQQDQLFAEVARVVQPGGLFVATDSRASDGLRAAHEGDTYVPIDPDQVAERLETNGFADVELLVNEWAWATRARVATPA